MFASMKSFLWSALLLLSVTAFAWGQENGGTLNCGNFGRTDLYLPRPLLFETFSPSESDLRRYEERTLHRYDGFDSERYV
jgi:hypothetical protein